MALISNIKGYINGNEWGVYEPAPSLLTYEEIVAMAEAEGIPRTNTVAELNSNAETYYNMLNEGNHIVTKTSGKNTVNCIDGICYASGSETRLIYYNNSLFISQLFMGSLC